MKPALVFLAFVALCPSVLSPAEKVDRNGYWWGGMNPSFKLGWVSGYAEAMDSAATSQMGACLATLPMYKKEFPNTEPKVLVERFCHDESLDYDGIAMGRFVDGIDAFYNDYRNKQLAIVWAIQYARDSAKGKPASELEAQVTLWRQCSAADRRFPMPRSDEDSAQIAKACTPPATK